MAGYPPAPMAPPAHDGNYGGQGNADWGQSPIDVYPGDPFDNGPMAQKIDDDYGDGQVKSGKKNKKSKQDKNVQIQPVETTYEGWTLEKAPGKTVGEGLTWQRVGKRPLPFDQAKLVSLVKAHRRRSKTIPVEDFQRLNSNQRGVIDQIIVDKQALEKNPSADWTLVDVQKDVVWRWQTAETKKIQIVLKRSDRHAAKAGIRSAPSGIGAYKSEEIVDLAEPSRVQTTEPIVKKEKKQKRDKIADDTSNELPDPTVGLFDDLPLGPPPQQQPRGQYDNQQPRYDDFGGGFPGTFADNGAKPPGAMPVPGAIPRDPYQQPYPQQDPQYQQPQQQQPYPSPRHGIDNPFRPEIGNPGDYDHYDTYNPYNPQDQPDRQDYRSRSPHRQQHRSRSRTPARRTSPQRRPSGEKEARRLKSVENRIEDIDVKLDEKFDTVVDQITGRLAHQLHLQHQQQQQQQNHDHDHHHSDDSSDDYADDGSAWSDPYHPLSTPPSTPPSSNAPRRGSLHNRHKSGSGEQTRYYREQQNPRYFDIAESYELRPAHSRRAEAAYLPQRQQPRRLATIHNYEGGRPRRAETAEDYPHRYQGQRGYSVRPGGGARRLSDFAEGYEEIVPLPLEGERVRRARTGKGVDYLRQQSEGGGRGPVFVERVGGYYH